MAICISGTHEMWFQNRPQGMLATKLINKINALEIKKMLIDNVIPAIQEKWPKSQKSIHLFIQQDNACPHCNPIDQDIVVTCSTDG